jgi:hypothetical protein
LGKKKSQKKHVKKTKTKAKKKRKKEKLATVNIPHVLEFFNDNTSLFVFQKEIRCGVYIYILKGIRGDVEIIF